MIEPKNVSQRAIEAAGGASVIAREFDLTPTSVFQWGKRDNIPAAYVPRICAMAHCLFQPHQLRPDIFDETQIVQV